MPNSLFSWPLLRTLGLYIGACWVAVEFADWMVGRYALPDRVVDVTLIGLLSFLPTVALVAYFHQAPGRQRFHPVEKVGIPANALVSAVIIGLLLYGPAEESVAVEMITVTDPSGEQISRPMVAPAQSSGVSLFFYDNETDDETLDWLQYGATVALKSDLEQHPFVKLWLPFSGMESYGMFQLRKAGYDDGLNVPVALMRSVASAGRMEYFVGGEIRAADDSDGAFTLVTTLYETGSATPVEEVVLAVPSRDGLFDAIDETTTRILSALDLPATPDPVPDLPVADRLTESLAAFEAHTRALTALLVSGDSEAALRHWGDAVTDDTSFAVAQVAMAKVLFQSGLTLDGGMAVQSALQHGYKLSDAERFQAKGLNYVFRGERDKELATYRAWTELSPDDPLAFAYLAMAYQYVANDADGALQAYERIYEIDPREDWVLAKIAYLHEVKQNREAAIQYYSRYAEARPDSPLPLLNLGRLHRREGKLVEARDFFERAAIVADSLVDPALSLAELSLREGRYEESLAHLQEAEQIARAPRQHAAVLRTRIAWHAQRGQEDEVLALLPRLAEVSEQYQSPVDVIMGVWVEYITHYVKGRQVEEGLRILRDFELKMQPPLNSLIDIGYLRLALAMQDAEAASAHGEVVEDLMETMSLDHFDYYRAYSKGVIDGIRGNLPEAIGHLENAIDHFDDSINRINDERARFQIMTDLADYYRRNGQPERAQEMLQAVLEVYPAYVDANLAMARLAHAAGDDATASTYLARVSEALSAADEDFPPLLAARELDARIGT